MNDICYVCLEGESKKSKFLPKRCECKTLFIHRNCYKKIEDKESCSVCKKQYIKPMKNPMREIERVLDTGMIEIFTLNRKNKKSGEYYCLYPNHTIAIQCYFIAGILHDEFYSFHPDGKIKNYCVYDMGIEVLNQQKLENMQRLHKSLLELLLIVCLISFFRFSF